MDFSSFSSDSFNICCSSGSSVYRRILLRSRGTLVQCCIGEMRRSVNSRRWHRRSCSQNYNTFKQIYPGGGLNSAGLSPVLHGKGNAWFLKYSFKGIRFSPSSIKFWMVLFPLLCQKATDLHFISLWSKTVPKVQQIALHSHRDQINGQLSAKTQALTPTKRRESRDKDFVLYGSESHLSLHQSPFRYCNKLKHP